MARHGIGEFHLQRVEERVLLQTFVFLAFARDVGIVVHHTQVQIVVLLARQRRRLRIERVEDYFRIDFRIVVVRELERHVGKAEAVFLRHLRDAFHHRHITICDEVDAIVVGSPEIVVFRHEQHVADGYFRVHIQHPCAYSLVEHHRPLVAPS